MEQETHSSTPQHITITEYKSGQWGLKPDVASAEASVSFEYNGRDHSLWAWPDMLEDLVAGHALLDLGGGYRKTSVMVQANGIYTVTTGDHLPNNLEPGKLHGAEIMEGMRTFMGKEGLWNGTGCFHRAGVFDAASKRVVHRTEDIGRHNCVDRLAGWASRTETPLSGLVLMISARMTSSLCAKAIRAGFKFIVSRSAVTSAALNMAQEHDITLIGFARDNENRFSVFHDLKTPRVLT